MSRKFTGSRSSVVSERGTLNAGVVGSSPTGSANKGMRVVMFWENGAYVSTLDEDFDKHRQELFEQYGPACFATVRFGNE